MFKSVMTAHIYYIAHRGTGARHVRCTSYIVLVQGTSMVQGSSTMYSYDVLCTSYMVHNIVALHRTIMYIVQGRATMYEGTAIVELALPCTCTLYIVHRVPCTMLVHRT